MPRIQTTTDLINSLPALVGYVPAGAIILITTGPATDVLDVQFAITASARITAAQAANLPELCGLNAQNAPGAVLVAVCGDWLADHVRDVLDHPAPAAQLWTTMAAHMRGRARIEALTIAAALYYSGRDALRATIALEVADALGAELDIALPKLGQMLTIALARAVSPDEVITILRATID